MNKSFQCKECGCNHISSADLVVCEWVGCTNCVEDSRTINIARHNPWTKFIAAKLCNTHLSELVIEVGSKLENTAFKDIPEE